MVRLAPYKLDSFLDLTTFLYFFSAISLRSISVLFKEEFKKDIPFSNEIYQISPTPEYPRGTKGRTAVFEVFKMDKEIENVILKSPTELEISKILRKKGMLTMKEDAMIKAFNKIIPFEEVNKL